MNKTLQTSFASLLSRLLLRRNSTTKCHHFHSLIKKPISGFLNKPYQVMAYQKISSLSTIQWNPMELLNGDAKHAVILLNHALDTKSKEEVKFFKNLWSRAVFTVSVDGGTNSLDLLIKQTNVKDVNEDNWIKRPDVVCGDFDSIRSELIDKYRRQGSSIVETPNQDETDFTKAVTIAIDQHEIDYQNFNYLVAFGSSNGRIDQYLSNLHTLHKFVDIIPIFLIDIGSNVSFVMSNLSKHVIKTPFIPTLPSWCSLVPLVEPSKVTTTGLRWNLHDDLIKFGSFISTSNQFDEETDEVVVITNKPLLFSMQHAI